MSFFELDWGTIASSLGGIGLLIYFLSSTCVKLFSDQQWFKKLKAKKVAEEKQKRQEEFEEFARSFSNQILAEVNETNRQQNEKIDQLIQSSNDVLRREIVKIYYKYRPYKRILQYDREALSFMFEDYSAQGGNSFVHALMDEMRTWDVVNTEEELRELVTLGK